MTRRFFATVVVFLTGSAAASAAAAGAAAAAETTSLRVETLVRPDKCEKVAEEGDLLRIHYVGRFDDADGIVFDASRRQMAEEGEEREVDEEEDEMYEFILGARRVIPGYEQGVPGMCEGETRALTVPPELGYGEEGYPGIIPGGATLHFTVELVQIVKKSERWGQKGEEL